MKTLAAVAFWLFCSIICEAYFNCGRLGNDCKVGKCDYDKGLCLCPNGTRGYDCGLNETLISDQCPVPCENDGICYEDSGTFGCYCNVTYTGDTCQYRRADVECNGANVTIFIRPYDGFGGKVYIKDSVDDPTCVFTGEVKNGHMVFEKTFSLHDGCQATVHNDTPSAGDVTYIRDVMIQYNINRETRLDQLVTTVCEHTVANHTELDTSIPDVDVTQKGNLTTDKTVTQYQPVKMLIQERSGSPLSPPIYIGRPLRLYIFLKDTALYKSVNVEGCVAYDGSKAKKQVLIENSCPVKESRDVIHGDLKKSEDGSAVIINFFAFKFVGNNNVEFECNVRACKKGDNKCQPKSCDGDDVGFGRRRRRDTDVQEPSNEETVVTDQIVVLDPFENDIIKDTKTTATECIMQTEILATIIILAVSILILFIVCFLLALKVMRSRFKVDSCDTSSAASYGTSVRIPGKF